MAQMFRSLQPPGGERSAAAAAIPPGQNVAVPPPAPAVNVAAQAPLDTPIHPLESPLHGATLVGALAPHLGDRELDLLSLLSRRTRDTTAGEIRRRVAPRLMQPPYYPADRQERLADQPRLRPLFRTFYHATTPPVATRFTNPAAPARIKAEGKGEFGSGFYAFDSPGATRSIAPKYAREHESDDWSIVRFRVPAALHRQLEEQPRNTERKEGYLRFPEYPKKPTELTGDLFRPQDRGANGETNQNWNNFVKGDKDSKTENRGYSLITGPILDTLQPPAPSPHPIQYLFANSGLDVLNDERGTRQVYRTNTQRRLPSGHGAVRGPDRNHAAPAGVAGPAVGAPAAAAAPPGPPAEWAAEVARIQDAIDSGDLQPAALKRMLAGLSETEGIPEDLVTAELARLTTRHSQRSSAQSHQVQAGPGKSSRSHTKKDKKK